MPFYYFELSLCKFVSCELSTVGCYITLGRRHFDGTTRLLFRRSEFVFHTDHPTFISRSQSGKTERFFYNDNVILLSSLQLPYSEVGPDVEGGSIHVLEDNCLIEVQFPLVPSH
ncbi:hypothetical protein M758_2G036000 [Ceratodon purpureus]|nr:hypothetical protein M758_2G036000 [Ceratodon purpureus]